MPISRANIVNFNTLTLYKNVNYKLVISFKINTNVTAFQKK